MSPGFTSFSSSHAPEGTSPRVGIEFSGQCTRLVSLAAGLAHAGEPQTLRENSWLCTTPEAYDRAVEAERKRQGNGLQGLKDQLLDAKLCMYVDHQYVAKMRVPVVTILERQGGRVHVSFTAEWRKRLAVLHEQITRIMYAGWTGAENLKDYEP